MSTTEILEYVKSFADAAHGKQVRKYTGERYIVHPVRVMEMVHKYNPETEVLAAALLHDVLEDTDVTATQMEAALLKVMGADEAKRVVQLVVDLTDIFIRKDYPRLKRRSRKEKEARRLSGVRPEAQTIKYADIIDNVTDIVKQDSAFAFVFLREAKKMLTVMKDGHPELREKAQLLVASCLTELPKPAVSM